MPEIKQLKKFHVEEADDGFSLHIEDEDGTILELGASREQIDLIADNLDDLLSETEEEDEVDEEDEAGDEKR